MGSDATRRAGFSLVELFVVTAIVATLAALLLPALGRAREKSRIVVCTGHLRQIGQAMAIYHGDWGSLPTENFSGYLMWNGVNYILYGRLVMNLGPGLGKVFYCPSSSIFTASDPDTGLTNIGLPGKITAGAYVQRGWSRGAPRTLDGSLRVLMTDLCDAPDRNHGAGLNALYTDGSARFFAVPDAWALSAAGAWEQLDQALVAVAP